MGTTPAQFAAAHFRCGQTSGWINMTFGVDVGLCPDDFVLDGYSAGLSVLAALCKLKFGGLCG